ncbi:MAG: MoaD/ThiS family protein [Acidimicrobiales bacterium]
MTGQVPTATGGVRVRLPAQLRTLIGVPGEVVVEVIGVVTQRSVLDALDAAYPALGGTLRDRASGRRRAFIRFYVGEEDHSNEEPDALLPDPVATGGTPLLVVGAMAGG